MKKILLAMTILIVFGIGIFVYFWLIPKEQICIPRETWKMIPNYTPKNKACPPNLPVNFVENKIEPWYGMCDQNYTGMINWTYTTSNCFGENK